MTDDDASDMSLFSSEEAGTQKVQSRRVAAHGWAHSCVTCGQGAAFGFNGRNGMDWYCGKHRHLGRAIPPQPMSRNRV